MTSTVGDCQVTVGVSLGAGAGRLLPTGSPGATRAGSRTVNVVPTPSAL